MCRWLGTLHMCEGGVRAPGVGCLLVPRVLDTLRPLPPSLPPILATFRHADAKTRHPLPVRARRRHHPGVAAAALVSGPAGGRALRGGRRREAALASGARGIGGTGGWTRSCAGAGGSAHTRIQAGRHTVLGSGCGLECFELPLGRDTRGLSGPASATGISSGARGPVVVNEVGC